MKKQINTYEITLSDGTIHQVNAYDPLEAKFIVEALIEDQSGLNAPYAPFNNAPFVLNVEVPDSMSNETTNALEALRDAVGGNIRKFVIDRLKYDTFDQMDKALSAEQIDSIALAIYNMEAREQGIIIGDQTGIGKGRQAAAILRYGIVNGYKPIFITEKVNLFSDLYRDMVDILSGHYKPFIVNSKSKNSDMRNAQDQVIYSSISSSAQSKVFKRGKVPKEFDYIVSTYSQFTTPSEWMTKGKSSKQEFLTKLGEKNLFILDESHNISGNSGIGLLMRRILRKSKGCVFLSATFAKRPDNLPIYGSKTAISDSNLNPEQLTEAIEKGGVALQEVISSQLVKEGQMIRRQRTFEGVQVNYITAHQSKQLHYSACDTITGIMRDIVEFQKEYVAPAINEMDKSVKDMGADITARKGTKRAGVNNSPYFSKLFNVINQMLFTLKSEDVANRAIKRLNQGKSVVIAFGNTMESFYNEYGLNETISCDFSEVLKKGLDSVLKITTTDIMGNSTPSYLSPIELGEDVYEAYLEIINKIELASVGFSASPIDVVTTILKKAGYKVGEVTGRSRYIDFKKGTFTEGKILKRDLEPRKTTFQKFQDNEYDVLLINQAGSTGASAHAIPTKKVPKALVKQRCMIILQAELDINKEVQKRGRIHRTGQVIKPIYDYVNSEIPAEKRLVMMLKSKLKSLDANTSSDQKNSESLLESPDFLNEIGDKIVEAWLKENPDINKMLDNPLKMGIKSRDSENGSKDAALKVSGRIAITPTDVQERFYSDVLERYIEEVRRLKSIDEYNLEMTDIDLMAETKSEHVFIGGKNSKSSFGGDTYMTKVMANNLKKPLSKEKIEMIIHEKLQGLSPEKNQENQIFEITTYYKQKIEAIKLDIINQQAETLRSGKKSPIYKKLLKENKESPIDNLDLEFRTRVQQAYLDKETNLIARLNSIKNNVLPLIEDLTIGKSVTYKSKRAIFLGFEFGKKSIGNPYAPSNIKAMFTVAGPEKTISFPLSGDGGHEIRKMASSLRYLRTNHLKDWNEHIKSMSSDRHIRFILTGNLLQAVGKAKQGALINYTLKDGGTNKGLLLPLDFDSSSITHSNFISVPASKALKVVQSITKMISLNNDDAYFYRKANELFFSVPLSAKKGAKFYKNIRILEHIKDGNFQSISSRMEAQVINLEGLLTELENEGASINVSRAMYQEDFKPNEITKIKWKALKLNHPKKSYIANDEDDIEMLEMIALALQLELELLEI